MIKATQILLIITLTFFISACGNNDSTSQKTEPSPSADEASHDTTGKDSANANDEKNANQNNEGQKDQEDKPDDQDHQQKNEASEDEDGTEQPLSQSEVLDTVKEQIDTDITVKLPKELPLNDDEHLTAATDSSSDEYSVIFFASERPISINNKKLNDASQARKVIHLKVKDFKNQAEADNEVHFEDFSKNGAEEVDLGHGITGYQDAGAGNLWTGWNEGRWALATHTHTDQGDKGVELARDTVDFLEVNKLPIPDKNGYISLDATGDDQSILWQKGTIVYRLDQYNEPTTGLKIATSME